MSNQSHIGYDIFSLKESIKFYQNVLNARVEFKNEEKGTACLSVCGQEINLFKRQDFEGYHSSILKSLHIGFQLNSKEEVDSAYKKAIENRCIITHKPFNRKDGDYSMFVQDPDGMQLEILFGNHENQRKRVLR